MYEVLRYRESRSSRQVKHLKDLTISVSRNTDRLLGKRGGKEALVNARSSAVRPPRSVRCRLPSLLRPMKTTMNEPDVTYDEDASQVAQRIYASNQRPARVHHHARRRWPGNHHDNRINASELMGDIGYQPDFLERPKRQANSRR